MLYGFICRIIRICRVLPGISVSADWASASISNITIFRSDKARPRIGPQCRDPLSRDEMKLNLIREKRCDGHMGYCCRSQERLNFVRKFNHIISG